jgi:large subunit ribosomal protein L9
MCVSDTRRVKVKGDEMQVLLQENVRNLGNLGDEVKVKPGYARNYLLPQGKAVRVTVENMAIFQEKRAELERKANELLQQAKKRASEFEQLTSVTLKVQASTEGKLYGALGVGEIAHAIIEAGVHIGKSELSLPSGSIKELGEFSAVAQFHAEVTATILVKVEQDA